MSCEEETNIETKKISVKINDFQLNLVTENPDKSIKDLEKTCKELTEYMLSKELEIMEEIEGTEIH